MTRDMFEVEVGARIESETWSHELLVTNIRIGTHGAVEVEVHNGAWNEWYDYDEIRAAGEAGVAERTNDSQDAWDYRAGKN